MGHWNLYFAAKLLLTWAGKLQPVWGLNLLLALALLVPLRSRKLLPWRRGLAIGAAVALLLAEIQFSPAWARASWAALTAFAPAYLLELISRLPLTLLLWPLLLALVVHLSNKSLGHVGTFVLLAVAAIPIWQSSHRLAVQAAAGPGLHSPAPPQAGQVRFASTEAATDHRAQLQAFRTAEAARRVSFAPLTPAPAEQFDIIVLHICSLSWDDLYAANGHSHPLVASFDYVFENFNSATSYSNPAAIRLLRASCGQQPHDALFRPAPAGCHLFTQLAHAGYRPQALFNHDGRHDNFREVVEREIGVLDVNVIPPRNLPIAMRAFDGSPLPADYAVLEQWYDDRLAQGSSPVALYYNTISLHDGNRLPAANLSSQESYPLRLNTLFNDIDRLSRHIERAGRRAALVFVPEHGTARRGHGGQITRLREIPTPSIVHVPVGIKLVGLPTARRDPAAPIVITEPSSYLALAQLLSGLVANSPYHADAPALSQYAHGLPQTRLVSENEDVVVMDTDTGYVVRTQGRLWRLGE